MIAFILKAKKLRENKGIEIMDYTVDEVRQELQAIRERVHHGELFDSMGAEIGRLIDQFEYDAPTTVEQLDAATASALQENCLIGRRR